MVLQTNSPQEANEMLTKTRSIFITLLASASIASAIAPAISQAEPPEGAAKAGTCELLRLARGLWNEAANRAEANGEQDLADNDRAEADKMVLEGAIYSCAWVTKGAVIVVRQIGLPISKVSTSKAPPSIPAVKKAIAKMRLQAAQK
jgi:hypothetical protein